MTRRDPLDDLLRSYFQREVAQTDAPAQPSDTSKDRPATSADADAAFMPDPRPAQSERCFQPDAGGQDLVAPARKGGIADVWAKVLIAAAAAVLILLPLRGTDLTGASARYIAEAHRKMNTGAVISSGLLSAQRVLRARFAIDGSADHTNHSGGSVQ